MSALLLFILQFFGFPVGAHHATITLGAHGADHAVSARGHHGSVRRSEGSDDGMVPTAEQFESDPCDISNGF